MTVYLLDEDLRFPQPEESEPDGLLAVGGDLRPERLLLAYSMGIFPWYSEGEPILWYSPDPRMLIRPDRLQLNPRFRRRLRHHPFTVTFDTCFKRVMVECTKMERTDQEGTWITRDMADAYTQLHEMGFAHSVEVWEEDHLVGGLYGVAIGASFCGESMFHSRSDASKIGLVTLVRRLQEWGFDFLDCQLPAPHLETWGGEQIPRTDYLIELAASVRKPGHAGTWSIKS